MWAGGLSVEKSSVKIKLKARNTPNHDIQDTCRMCTRACVNQNQNQKRLYFRISHRIHWTHWVYICVCEGGGWVALVAMVIPGLTVASRFKSFLWLVPWSCRQSMRQYRYVAGHSYGGNRSTIALDRPHTPGMQRAACSWRSIAKTRHHGVTGWDGNSAVAWERQCKDRVIPEENLPDPQAVERTGQKVIAISRQMLR